MDSRHQPGGLGSHQPRPLACDTDPVLLLLQPTHSGTAAAQGPIDAKDPQALRRRIKKLECNLEDAEPSTAAAILVSAVSAGAQDRSVERHRAWTKMMMMMTINIGSSSFLPQATPGQQEHRIATHAAMGEGALYEKSVCRFPSAWGANARQRVLTLRCRRRP
jgi:hypothetical protein